MFFLPLRCLSHKSAKKKNNDKVNDPDRQGVQPEKNNCDREGEVRVADKQLKLMVRASLKHMITLLQ